MNHGRHPHWLRRATTVAILAAATAAPAANAHPGYTGDAVSRYLASHPAGINDVMDRYLNSDTSTSVQSPNPVSDVLDTMRANRNQQIAAQNPVSDVLDTMRANRNRQIAAQTPVSDVLDTLRSQHNQRIAAQARLTANAARAVSRSFSWRDAGIGASATVALILLLTAAGLQLAHRRRNRLAY
jgi:hypothetical protein